MPLQGLRSFFATEAAGGLVMVAAAIAALVVANSPWSGAYESFLAYTLTPGIPAFSKTVLHWINDGLMAVFFLVVGLEIKREATEGELSSGARLALPVIAAIGGMVLPAVLYVLINDDPLARRGWAIPTATDIAFSLAVLSLFGTRVSLALKMFLTAVAIVDDLGAIVVIALFYTEELSLPMLAGATAGVVLLAILNFANVRRLAPYLLVGLATWACVLKSGVHATLAGVATALAIPALATSGRSPGHVLEEKLHPWVAFGILPVFAFANAGIAFDAVSVDVLLEPIPLGIIVGLLAGKTLGIYGATALAIGAGLAPRPQGASHAALLGIAAIGGIGFTMSLFIGSLAFELQEPRYYELVKLGVLAGSVASALFGCALLAIALPRRQGSP